MKLGYVRLLVRNFDACVAFYRDVIGFPVKMVVQEAKFAEFDTGETALEIYDRDSMAEVVGLGLMEGGDRVLLTLQVDDIDAEFESLKAKGVNFEEAPRDQLAWGARTAYFRDPDGTLIELFQHVQAHEE
ncbi:MAG: VOC family protein [Chloroflexota bacterium]